MLAVHLFAQLALVRQAVDNLALEQASKEILEAMGGFTDQWDKFTAHLEVVSKRLEARRRRSRSSADPAGASSSASSTGWTTCGERQGLADQAEACPAPGGGVGLTTPDARRSAARMVSRSDASTSHTPIYYVNDVPHIGHVHDGHRRRPGALAPPVW